MTAPGSHGFSLIEVLAGMSIAGVLLVSSVGVFQTALLQHRLSRDTTRATALAAERLEELAALPGDASDLEEGSSSDQPEVGLVRRTFIADDVPAPGAKTIKVTVTRVSTGRGVTLVAVRGR